MNKIRVKFLRTNNPDFLYAIDKEGVLIFLEGYAGEFYFGKVGTMLLTTEEIIKVVIKGDILKFRAKDGSEFAFEILSEHIKEIIKEKEAKKKKLFPDEIRKTSNKDIYENNNFGILEDKEIKESIQFSQSNETHHRANQEERVVPLKEDEPVAINPSQNKEETETKKIPSEEELESLSRFMDNPFKKETIKETRIRLIKEEESKDKSDDVIQIDLSEQEKPKKEENSNVEDTKEVLAEEKNETKEESHLVENNTVDNNETEEYEIIELFSEEEKDEIKDEFKMPNFNYEKDLSSVSLSDIKLK